MDRPLSEADIAVSPPIEGAECVSLPISAVSGAGIRTVPVAYIGARAMGRCCAFLKKNITTTAVHIPNARLLARLTSQALGGAVQSSHRGLEWFKGTKLLYHLIESHQCLLGAGWLSSATEVLIRTQHELIAYRHRPRRQLGCARALCARPQLIVLPPFDTWLRPSPTDLHSRPGGQSRQ